MFPLCSIRTKVEHITRLSQSKEDVMHNFRLRYSLPSSAVFFTMLIYGYYQAWS